MEEQDIWAKKKVCIVDDDADLREIYSMTFNREGFDVVLATDGEEGLKMIRAERPDIILLDLHMPVKNGIEVLEELDHDKELSKIPVIVLSNIDHEEAFKKVGEFETRFYLIKSLNSPQKVVDYVREVL
ncbi:MAG: response regulator [Candidatus Moraniibacteriota bacterium]